MRFLTKFALVVIGTNFLPPNDAESQRRIVAAGTTFQCTPVAVYDGDGPVWCAEGPHIRLSGIAAREMDGTCRSNQPCPAASAIEARDALVKLLGGPRGLLPTGHVIVSGPVLSCRSLGSAGGTRTAAWCTALPMAISRAGWWRRDRFLNGPGIGATTIASNGHLRANASLTLFAGLRASELRHIS